MQNERFDKAAEHTAFCSLNPRSQEFVKAKSLLYRLTFSQIQRLITIVIDLQMWGDEIQKVWVDESGRDECLQSLSHAYEELKNSPKTYPYKVTPEKREVRFEYIDKAGVGFGTCPVASPKTRCCGLLTLDVYEGCGFDCSYCSIQTFYGGALKSDKNFADKLSRLQLSPDKLYHIGTGQSSDSLMLGNKNGTLEALINFAAKNPNVILEFKSKSDNVSYLLKNKLPRNIICTFSLNPQAVIDSEEHFTASLCGRIKAAKSLSENGVLVGFHLHPMIYFDGWLDEYSRIADALVSDFSPQSVALVSLGTLTFTKPVLRQIRARAAQSKILQMPLHESCGKYSYPLDIKEQMFSGVYRAFEKWHGKVFFYLCMEDKSLWQKVFGYEYESNEAFEENMKKAYMKKITLFEA